MMYKDLVTIVITHWDLAENKEDDFKNITKEIKDYFGIESFIFVGKGADPQEISKAFYLKME